MKRPDYGNATPEDVAQALMRSRNVRLKKGRSNRPDPGGGTRDDHLDILEDRGAGPAQKRAESSGAGTLEP